MKFLNGLFGRKEPNAATTKPVSGVEVDDLWNHAAEANDDAPVPPMTKPSARTQMASVDDTFEAEDAEDLSSIDHVVGSTGKAPNSGVNIWDLEDGQEETVSPVQDRASSRARRNRTRLIGFDKSDGDVVDLFEEAPKAEVSTTDRAQFPVGWLLVMEGPGRGYSIPLVAGMSQIGRGEDQAVALDFGDTAISRNNHAAIVYDAKDRSFLLGHGGKANIVRLNDKPVISNESLKDGDRIQIGETTLELKTLCGPDFDWNDAAGEEEQDDVAIA